jgi:hypothetical protein
MNPKFIRVTLFAVLGMSTLETQLQAQEKDAKPRTISNAEVYSTSGQEGQEAS